MRRMKPNNVRESALATANYIQKCGCIMTIIIIMNLLPQKRVWIPRVEGVTQLCSQEGPPSFSPSVQLPIPVPPPCCVTGPWGKGQVRSGKEPGPRALPGEWGTGGFPKGRQPSGEGKSFEGPSAAQTQPGPCNPGQREHVCSDTSPGSPALPPKQSFLPEHWGPHLHV